MDRSIEIYTYRSNPFGFGKSYDIMKTKVCEYERISIGKGYFGLIVKNPCKELWHMVEENCGAIIGTNGDRGKLIKQVKDDVEAGDEFTMKEQIIKGKAECARAQPLENKAFFSAFRTRNGQKKL